jgi:hypothetical protein
METQPSACLSNECICRNLVKIMSEILEEVRTYASYICTKRNLGTLARVRYFQRPTQQICSQIKTV